MTEVRDSRVALHLRRWMNCKRRAEIDDKLISHLRKLDKGQLKEAVKKLGGQKKFVRGTKGNQLAVPVILQTEDMAKQFAVSGLIDSCQRRTSSAN